MSNELITLHFGSRQPKKYMNEAECLKAGVVYDPAEPALHPEQPGEMKCRVKLRFSKDSSLSQSLDEAKRCWGLLDHGAPAWVSGTNDFAVKAVAVEMGITEIRAWEPAEGDE